jgi:hypothetical protein
LALRAVSQHEDSLDELRNRAGILLSAVSISTSFLGALTLKRHVISGPGWAALVMFVLSMIGCVYVLYPGKTSVQMQPGQLIHQIDSQPDLTLADWQAGLAEELAMSLADDKPRTRRLAAFAASSLLLIAEIVLWIIDLSRR